MTCVTSKSFFRRPRKLPGTPTATRSGDMPYCGVAVRAAPCGFVRTVCCRFILPAGRSLIRSACRGFTLIELLTVIAIVSVLAALLIPAIGKIRERGHAVHSMSNLRQIGTAMEVYATENSGTYPRAYEDGENGHLTWMWKLATILAIPEDAMGSSPKPRSMGVFVDPAHDPERVRRRNVSYAMNWHIKTAKWNYRKDALTSPVQTILIGEIDSNVEVIDGGRPDRYLVSRHVGNSGHLLFADGHVERLEHIELINNNDKRWWPTP